MTSARPASRTVCRIRTSCSEMLWLAVDDEHGDLGAVDRGRGAQRGVVLVPGGLLDPLADAGGVDEAPGLAAELDQLVDRVDGGAGDVVDDDAVLAREPVEQRGLADVGLADDRDPARAADLGEGLGRGLRQRGEDGVEHVARAAAVQGRDRPGLAEPEVPQAVGLGLGALVVDLVGGQDDRLAGGAQDADDGLVGVGDPDGGVDHEEHGVGELDRDLGLGADRRGEAAAVGVPAAGVDDREGRGRPSWRRRRPGRG